MISLKDEYTKLSNIHDDLRISLKSTDAGKLGLTSQEFDELTANVNELGEVTEKIRVCLAKIRLSLLDL